MAFLAGFASNSISFATSHSDSIDVGAAAAGRKIIGFAGQVTDATPDLDATSEITLGGSSTGVTLAASGTNPTGQTGAVGRWFTIDVPSGLSGAQTLAVTLGAGSTAARIFIIAACYSSAGAITAGYGSNSFNNNPSATVSSATGNEVALFVMNVAGGATLTPTAPASALSGVSGGNGMSLAGIREDGAASVTIDGTYSGSQEYCSAWFSIEPAAINPAPALSLPGVQDTTSSSTRPKVTLDYA